MESKENINDEDVEARRSHKFTTLPNLPKALTLNEKKYLLAIERGDLPTVRKLLSRAQRKNTFDINCVDSLGRGALTIAIDQENLEMVELLVIMGVETRDALLYAINVEFVEAVELLLEHEELIHKEGEPYSWQKVDLNTAVFTPDITPLILAAHRNNYEILKILLDRGATIPMPHDIKCGCDDCVSQSEEDSLRYSLSRLNEYKALASPSLMALSSSDPLLTAFQLSWELRNLAFAEPESKSEYMDLRKQCQQFAVDLLQQSRSSSELAIILNHDPNNPPYQEGEHMKLARLELAILYKQKKFVSHPNIQQLLAALWYEGVPGFRRKSTVQKLMIIIKVALFFPLYCLLYTFAPETKSGKLMRKPFMKFLIHASSYLFFLLLLILVSLRADDIFFEYVGSQSMKAYVLEKYQKQRGNTPTFLEYAVLIYVIGFIFEETQEIFTEGIKSYLRNLWNFIDFTRNLFYSMTFGLRAIAYLQQCNEIYNDPQTAYLRREEWNAFDPQLIAEGLFAAANILSALKLVHLFSINPHLGPLQISLGRMVIDIVKFFFIYSLVLFAFACGLNQLLWYFSDLEKQKCYHLPSGEPDFDNAGDSCMKWRRFANVFESSQSLFWASFGMVDLDSFELTGIKTYTRFWGLLMFGSYSVINVIVLLNLLIAMMSNSYAMIEQHSDTEWKFARTKLWMSYFEESGTLPPPFNIFPKPKHLFKLLGLRKKDKLKRMSTKRRNREEKERDYRYTAVMRALVWRYVSSMHRKYDESLVTEDDINELKSDISSFRYELIELLSRNGMDVSSAEKREKGKFFIFLQPYINIFFLAVLGKRMKIWERRLMKDFKVAPVAIDENEELFAPPPEGETSLARFRRIAKMAAMDSSLNKWQAVVKGAYVASQIGRCHRRDSFKKQQNLQKAITEAKRLAAKSPDSSRSASPQVTLPDYTGAEIVKLIKDDTSPYGTIRGSVSISPNVTILDSNNKKSTVLSPTIAIFPPEPLVTKNEVTQPKQSTEQDLDLINLESNQASSVFIFETSNGIPSDQLDKTDKNIMDSSSKSPTRGAQSPFMIPSPPVKPLETSKNSSPSRSFQQFPKLSSPDKSLKVNETSPSKQLVSTMRLRFEQPQIESGQENEDKDGFSSEDSESKGSCDELNRIISSENFKEDRSDVQGKDELKQGEEKFEDQDLQLFEEAKHEFKASLALENVSDVEDEIHHKEKDKERSFTPRPLTPQPLSPPSDSPPRAPTPLTQRNIHRVHDSRRILPEFGWL
ncbi:transient-receptor-potential-like protein isoform X2 [Anthonomus grandis grandis]|uniref:transient-receptor-potential-like protein isoform X2 n=1 Tax=Anthonomus grandis grandis TaxID=2921223 RepID=UPI0021666C98|nr:transient-receptor-potential-like protein isoform X2 [Anthonomus grandis grandis]